MAFTDRPHLTSTPLGSEATSLIEATRLEGSQLHDNLKSWHNLAKTHRLETWTVVFDQQTPGFKEECSLLKDSERWSGLTSLVVSKRILRGPDRRSSVESILGATDSGLILVFPKSAGFVNNGPLWLAENSVLDGAGCIGLAVALRASLPFRSDLNPVHISEAQQAINQTIERIASQLPPTGLVASRIPA